MRFASFGSATLFLAACMPIQPMTQMKENATMSMSTETNKEVLRRWWEALNQGTALDIIGEIYGADYVLHDPSQPEPVVGLDGVRGFVSGVTTGFPDGHYTIEQLIAEGDTVVQLISAQGTHKGEFAGIPATGKAIDIWLMVISRLADNKIVEEWQLVDSLSMLQQLGVA
jgi:steroid delta-isomerase-like uncharacterized protein